MPTYEYVCPERHSFEKIQKITERPRTRCPVCGKVATRKISGGAGLVFKGTGFYITDYGKDGKGPRKGGDGETAPKKAADAPAAAGAAAPKTDTPKVEGKKSDAPTAKKTSE